MTLLTRWFMACVVCCFFFLPLHVLSVCQLRSLKLADEPISLEGCDSQTDEGGLCELDVKFCRERDIFARRLRCGPGGAWLWDVPSSTNAPTTAPPAFCPEWGACVVTQLDPDGLALTCDGSNVLPGSGHKQLPNHMDPRLHHVTLTKFAALTTIVPQVSTLLANVKVLNLSSNGIEFIKELAFTSSRLQVLDLSYNKLTRLESDMLPPFGHLRAFYAQGNPLVHIGASTFASAMSACRRNGLTAPQRLLHGITNCTIETYMGQDSNNATLHCSRPHCSSITRVPSPSFFCGDHDGSSGPTPSVPSVELCDSGAIQCASGKDEERCRGRLVDATSEESLPQDCTYLRNFLLGSFVVRFGDLVLELQQEATLALQTPILLWTLDQNNTFVFTYVDNDRDRLIQYTSGRGIFDGDDFHIKLNATLKDVNGNASATTLAQCNITFGVVPVDVEPPSSTSTTSTPVTTILPSPVAADGKAKKTELTASLAGGLLLLMVIALVGTLMLRRQGRRQQFLRQRFAATAGRLPPRCIETADERFMLQYAPLLGGADACGSAYARFRISTAQVTVSSQVLGVGHFGMVALGHLTLPAEHPGYKVLGPSATRHASMVPAAVKTVKAGGDEALIQLLVEARLLAAMMHPHLVRLLAVQEEHVPMLIVMEYCTLGDLRTFLRTGQDATLSCSRAVVHADMGRQVGLGLAYLHSKLCLHRDLAARNVLVAPVCSGCTSCATTCVQTACGVVLKLADLGLARVVADAGDYYRSTSDGAVPVRWQCPVSILSRIYSAKSDVYSFGVLLWEIHTGGATPYGDILPGEVVASVRAGHRLPRPHATAPEAVVTLIRACTQLDVTARPTMSSVCHDLNAACRVAAEEDSSTSERSAGAYAANALFNSSMVARPVVLQLLVDEGSQSPQTHNNSLPGYLEEDESAL